MADQSSGPLTGPSPKRGLAERARSLIAVTLVTVLVWLLAEGESLQTATYTVRVDVGAGENSGLRVMPAGDWSGVVRLDVEGPSAAVSALSTATAGGIPLPPDGSESGIPVTLGPHEVDLARAIGASKALAASGVRVVSVEPPTLLVNVDEIVDVVLPVAVQLPPGVEAEAQATPTTVSLRAPSEIAAGLGDARAVVRLSLAQVEAMAPGVRQRLPGLPVTLPGALTGQPGVSSPPPVDVSLTIARKTASITTSVPIWVELPAAISESYRVVFETADIAGVTATGPVALINRLEAGERLLRARPVLPLAQFAGLTQRTAFEVEVGFGVVGGVGIDAGGGVDFAWDGNTLRVEVEPLPQALPADDADAGSTPSSG